MTTLTFPENFHIARPAIFSVPAECWPERARAIAALVAPDCPLDEAEAERRALAAEEATAADYDRRGYHDRAYWALRRREDVLWAVHAAACGDLADTLRYATYSCGSQGPQYQAMWDIATA